ncbi:MAG: hypothetical protein KatS3mg004_0824 [Bryobacteraceae bacterium]|nr:MAG: hypothetical protein KatS3mg004_0824 [Bryobacteraceae bacterium]
MSGSTAKKVLVDRYDRTQVKGFVQTQTLVQGGEIELLSTEGAVLRVPVSQVKTVSFVRDLNGPSVWTERREFLSRPKTPGLWIELRFRDGSRLEGVAPNDLLLMEGQGVTLTPPDPAGNTQRVFAPRESLAGAAVLGVVGATRRRAQARPESARQIRLFGEE